jgi:hypothetical protein
MVACMIHYFFKKQYKLSEDGSYDLNARYMFEYNANDVVADAMYYARLEAIKAWYRASDDDRPMPKNKVEWSSIYLMKGQYLEVNKLLKSYFVFC